MGTADGSFVYLIENRRVWSPALYSVQLLGLLFFPNVFSIVLQCTDRSAGLQPRVRDIFIFPAALSYSCNTVSGFSTMRDHIQMSFNGDC